MEHGLFNVFVPLSMNLVMESDMGVFISVNATSLSQVNFTAYCATCCGRTTILKQKIYY
jgi:hypothetical protein